MLVACKPTACGGQKRDSHVQMDHGRALREHVSARRNLASKYCQTWSPSLSVYHVD